MHVNLDIGYIYIFRNRWDKKAYFHLSIIDQTIVKRFVWKQYYTCMQ